MLVTQGSRDYFNANHANYTHIISIVAPDDTELKPLHDHHAVYRFWDVDKKLENKFRCYNPPCIKDAIDPVFQADKWWLESIKLHKPFVLLIHCDAGVSRSAAVTLGVLWRLSSHVFAEDIPTPLLREYIDSRKVWCSSVLDDGFSTPMRRFIDGRFNPGVKPNQAILRIYRMTRDILPYFPW